MTEKEWKLRRMHISGTGFGTFCHLTCNESLWQLLALRLCHHVKIGASNTPKRNTCLSLIFLGYFSSLENSSKISRKLETLEFAQRWLQQNGNFVSLFICQMICKVSALESVHFLLQHPVLEKAAKELQKHREQGKLVVPVFDDESSREHRVLHTTCSNCPVCILAVND